MCATETTNLMVVVRSSSVQPSPVQQFSMVPGVVTHFSSSTQPTSVQIPDTDTHGKDRQKPPSVAGPEDLYQTV